MALTEDVQNDAAAAEDFARLTRLLEEHHVEEARQLAPELARKWPASRQIQHYARALEPPKILPTTLEAQARSRSFEPDHDWLEAHAHEYPGCWIATFRDRLIAADPDLDKVLAAVGETLDPATQLAFLHHQPANQE